MTKLFKPIKPQEPIKFEIYSHEKLEEKILASKYYIITDNQDKYNDILFDILDQEGCLEVDHYLLNNDAKMFSLQDFLDSSKDLEKNIDPNNLCIDMSYDRSFNYIKLSIKYVKYLSDSELKEKQKLIDDQYYSDMKIYAEKLASYNERLIKYNKLLIESEIKECEEKLNMLKSKLK